MLKADFKSKYQKEIRKLASKHKLTEKEVVNMYFEQFKLIKKMISADSHKEIEDRKSVKVLGLGKFEFNPYIAKKLTELKKKKDERKISHSETTPEDGDGSESN